MFRKPYFTAALFANILLIGCIIPGARIERAEILLQQNDSLLLVDEGDFLFQMVLPKDGFIMNEPKFHLDNTGSVLHIVFGPSFHLTATIVEPEQIDLPLNEGVFYHEIMDTEDNATVYKRKLPDGSYYDYGLTQLTRINDTYYLFRSASEGEFTFDDVLRMKSALASVKM
jgi:hypothetical protein